MSEAESFISDKVDIFTSLIDNETDIDVLRRSAHKMIELLLLADQMMGLVKEKQQNLTEQRDNYHRLAKNVLNATSELKVAVDAEEWEKLTENSDRLGEFIQRASEIVKKDPNN